MLRSMCDARSARFESLEDRRYMTGTLPDPGSDPAPSSVAGSVYLDANKNRQYDQGESGIAGVTVQLIGYDDLGKVYRTATTNSNGYFEFGNLRPGKYTLVEIQPDGYADGADTVGSAGGTIAGDDVITDIDLPAGTWAGMYLFGEMPLPQPPVQPPVDAVNVSAGMTGTIEFWHSARGQNLIKSLNGGAYKTQLGTWLAKNFPNLYGAFKSDVNGKTNTEVAAFFQRLYAAKDNKLDAEVMALALSCYVTKRSLAGNIAQAWNFRVTNIGTAGAACAITKGMSFYYGHDATMSAWNILRGINAETVDGKAFGAGPIRRTMCWRLVNAINEAGKVG